MIYASPTVIATFSDGRKKKSGTVIKAQAVSRTQPMSYGPTIDFHPAHAAIGKAKQARNAM
jgi:hypothetical protein